MTFNGVSVRSGELNRSDIIDSRQICGYERREEMKTIPSVPIASANRGTIVKESLGINDA